MKIEEIRTQCTGCTACKSVCPKECISFKYDEEGFLYPYIDKKKCIQCSRCEKACPCLSFDHQETHERHTFYGASTDPDVLNRSTSGGAFYHIAQVILASGGIVYGAAFDYKNRLLRHVSTDECPLGEIQKSKYLESDMSNTISEIQKQINNERPVLFCGTPCQVCGLVKTVNDPRRMLLTCDFICHGVPSSVLFKEHLEFICKNQEIQHLDFRPKEFGWGKKYLFIIMNQRNYIKPLRLDSFYAGYMTYNAFMRKSCYNCQFRQHHFSDITIADFWRWMDYNPNLSTNKGLSLIVTNTEKGFNVVSSSLAGFDLNKIDNFYSNYLFQEKEYPNALQTREKFYQLYHSEGFEQAARKTYFSYYPKENIKYIIKKLLRIEK